MGVNKKGGLVGGFDQLRAPDAPTISVSGGDGQVTVTITNPSDTGGGDITSYAVSALTGPIEDTTFAVTVVSDGGNKYAIDGTTQATLTLYKGHTYIFDQSDSSNSSHPLRLSTTSNGSHGGGSEYTTGVTTSGTPGSAGAFTKIAIATDAPDTLYYYCTNHSGMGGTANLKASLQGGASGSSSPITVSSLTNDEAYNVRASAINVFGQSPYSAATSSTPTTPERGVFAGGTTSSSQSDFIEYITITSTGNSTEFGNLQTQKAGVAGCASSTRGIFGGGHSTTNQIDYITILSTGNASDFGDLSVARKFASGLSNSTRGVFGGGSTGSNSDVIDYITIASTGNATDFGNMQNARQATAGCASTTRGIIFGGDQTGGPTDTIDYITIGSTGNASDFGDLTLVTSNQAAFSSSTRGINAGGASNSARHNVISYVTIASTGNATDFGDLLAAINQCTGCAGSTRGIIAGGYNGSAAINVIQYITIASTGNSTDFGDLNVDTDGWGASYRDKGGCSNSHGGLS